MTISANPPIEIPLEKLTVKQKWDLVQALCDDLSGPAAGEIEMPAWHGEVLEQREQRIASGHASWLPLEEAIRSLEAKFY